MASAPMYYEGTERPSESTLAAALRRSRWRDGGDPSRRRDERGFIPDAGFHDSLLEDMRQLMASVRSDEAEPFNAALLMSVYRQRRSAG